MAAISDPGAPAGETPDQLAARMAAMARAAGGATPVAGYTGPAGPGSGAPSYGAPTPTPGYSDPNGGGVGGLFAGPGGTPAIADTPATGPAGATGPLGPASPTAPPSGAPKLYTPGQTALPGTPTSAPQGPDAIQRALNAVGSIPRSSAPPVTGSMAPALTQVPAQQGTTAPAPSTNAPAATGATPTSPNSPVTNPGPVENQNTGAPETGTGNLSQLTGSITNQIAQLQQGLNAPGTPSDATAVFLKQSQAILGMLDQQEQQLRADAEKQGTTIDPSTQFTIDKLRQTLEDNLKSTRETLNSRGLYESGILLELENRLQKGSASDQAQILNDRLSKLQAELNAGLTNIRTQRFQTSSQFGLAAGNAQTQADSQGKTLAAQREQAALQAMLNLRGQQSAEQQAAASLAQQNAQFNSTQAYNTQQAALQRAAAAATASRSTGGGTSAAAPATATTGATGNGTVVRTDAVTGQANSADTIRAAQARIQQQFLTSDDAVANVESLKAQIVAQVGQAGYNTILATAQALPPKSGGMF